MELSYLILSSDKAALRAAPSRNLLEDIPCTDAVPLFRIWELIPVASVQS